MIDDTDVHDRRSHRLGERGSIEGNLMKDLYFTPWQRYYLIVISTEVTESLWLLLKNLSDGLNGVAVLELGSEWVLDEIHP